MKRDDYAIEQRIAEALQAAIGVRGTAEVPAGAGPETDRSAERAAAAIDSLPWGLEGLIRPSAASSSSWRDVAASLNPLIGGLLRLFGGGGATDTPRLPPAARPEPARYEAGFERGGKGLFLADYDLYGRMRPAGSLAAAPIVVQVDAMDSRSFMERAPEIAEALRRVLLESDGIRTVLDE
jgi:hypothetical protein